MTFTVRIVAPEIRTGDAVGNHCLYLAQAWRERGHAVTLHAHAHSAAAGEVLDYPALFDSHRADDILLLSFSTYQPQLRRILALPGRKLVYFHGVTPVELLLEHDPLAAYWSSKALVQLPELAVFDHIVANSHWNLADLARHFPHPPAHDRVSVIPPITPDMPLLRRPPAAPRAWQQPLGLLTVGRLAPHKRVEDVIRIVADLRDRGVEARLTLVGGATSDDYLQLLRQTVQQLDLLASVDFRGHVSDEALDQCYAAADLLVSASLHEAFCIPVLEAMQLGIPILLRSGTAASEVAQGAGLEFSTVDEASNLIGHLLADAERRSQLRHLGQARAAELIRQSSIDAFAACLEGLR